MLTRPRSRRQRMLQQDLPLRTWGGRRKGAGRKPKGASAGVPHRSRPEHKERHPLHVTLRLERRVPSLRRQALFEGVRGALARASRSWFRLVHFSVQSDHVHLLVEAHDKGALSRGMAGLSIRVARSVNRALGRLGRVFGDRYHARPLKTPREVRHCLVYVLMNFKKHARDSGSTGGKRLPRHASLRFGCRRNGFRSGPRGRGWRDRDGAVTGCSARASAPRSREVDAVALVGASDAPLSDRRPWRASAWV